MDTSHHSKIDRGTTAMMYGELPPLDTPTKFELKKMVEEGKVLAGIKKANETFKKLKSKRKKK